jgi:hypothetical protein
MGKAKDKQMKKHDYEITFHDSPDYFIVENSKMIFENQMVRFICFDLENKFLEDCWYPMISINRIKRY